MNYVKSLAKQLAPKGIRVNAVAPGPIWTPLQVSGGATQEKLEKFGGWTPLGRAGQPAELCSIYVQLAAADASYASGQVYGSAGGSGHPDGPIAREKPSGTIVERAGFLYRSAVRSSASDTLVKLAELEPNTSRAVEAASSPTWQAA
jgi:hypothetical protein